MDRFKDILLIVFACALAYFIFFQKHDNNQFDEKKQKAYEDSLINVNKINQVIIDSLKEQVAHKDTIVIIQKQRQSKQAYEDHKKILAIDSLSDDSIYIQLTKRYLQD